MKNKIKKLSIILFALIILSTSFITVNAAEGLKVNSVAEIGVGDTFTYSFCIDDCKEALHGIQMHLYFDPEYLEIQKDSITHDGLDEYVVDVTKNNNYYSMNWQGGTNGKIIEGRQSLVSIDFKVLKAGETDIEYFVQELFNFDVTDPDSHQLNSYTFTFDIIYNKKKLAENIVPKIVSDQNVLNDRQGEFINYKDGKGEENHGESVTDAQNIEIKHEPVTGGERTNTDNVAPSETSGGNMYIYIFAGIIIIAVVGVLFIKLKNSKNLVDSDEKINSDEENN